MQGEELAQASYGEGQPFGQSDNATRPLEGPHEGRLRSRLHEVGPLRLLQNRADLAATNGYRGSCGPSDDAPPQTIAESRPTGEGARGT